MKFFIQTTVQYLTAIAAASSVILGMIVFIEVVKKAL